MFRFLSNLFSTLGEALTTSSFDASDSTGMGSSGVIDVSSTNSWDAGGATMDPWPAVNVDGTPMIAGTGLDMNGHVYGDTSSSSSASGSDMWSSTSMTDSWSSFSSDSWSSSGSDSWSSSSSGSFGNDW